MNLVRILHFLVSDILDLSNVENQLSEGYKSISYLLGVLLTQYLTGATLAYMFYKQGVAYQEKEFQKRMRALDPNLGTLVNDEEEE